MTRLEVCQSALADDSGRWRLHLLPLEVTIIEALPDQLEALLADPDGNRRVIERLFPPQRDRREDEAADRALLGRALLDSRRELLAGFRALLGRGRRDDQGLHLDLEAAQMDLVLRFANDVRMVLSTDLGIEDNLGEAPPVAMGPSDSAKWALLEYLGGLEALLVDALCREM